MKVTRIYGVVLAATLALTIGCQSRVDDEKTIAEGNAILQEAQTLSCTLQKLEAQTKALWDEVVLTLDKNLPADMPAVERKNMLAVRNTELIEMFMNYDALDSSIHQLVRKAGVTDTDIARQVLQTKQQLEANQIRFSAFLKTISGQNEAETGIWEKKYEKAHHSNCK